MPRGATGGAVVQSLMSAAITTPMTGPPPGRGRGPAVARAGPVSLSAIKLPVPGPPRRPRPRGASDTVTALSPWCPKGAFGSARRHSSHDSELNLEFKLQHSSGCVAAHRGQVRAFSYSARKRRGIRSRVHPAPGSGASAAVAHEQLETCPQGSRQYASAPKSRIFVWGGSGSDSGELQHLC